MTVKNYVKIIFALKSKKSLSILPDSDFAKTVFAGKPYPLQGIMTIMLMLTKIPTTAAELLVSIELNLSFV